MGGLEGYFPVRPQNLESDRPGGVQGKRKNRMKVKEKKKYGFLMKRQPLCKGEKSSIPDKQADVG